MLKEIMEGMRQNTPAYHSGWGGPEYTSWQDEQMSWKQTCYIGDWSFLWDIEVSGADALRLFRETGINSVNNFPVGRAKHLVQCSDDGKVIGEGILMRMADDVFRTQSTTAFWTSYVLEKGGYDASWKQLRTFQFQVAGPTALAVCEAATGESLTDIKFMHFRPVTIAGRTVYALRQGMAGEIGFEFHGDEADAPAVYAAFLEAGKPHGIRRLGRRTVMINHLEAAFPTSSFHYIPATFTPYGMGFREFIGQHFDTYGHVPTIRGSFVGNDINDYTFSPYELGWGRSVAFDHEFVGRGALEAEAANPRRTRVTLEFNADDTVGIYASLFQEAQEPYTYLEIPHVARWICWIDGVYSGDKLVGVSANPGYSLYFRKVLALAYIDVDLAKPGTELEILWGEPGHPQTKIRATVAPAPYKTDNRRVGIADPAQ